MPTLPRDTGSPGLPVSRALLLSPDSSRPSGEQTRAAGRVGLLPLQMPPLKGARDGATSASSNSDDDDELDEVGYDDGDSLTGSTSDSSCDLEDVPLATAEEPGWGQRPSPPLPKVTGLRLTPPKGATCGGPPKLSPIQTTSVCVDLLSHAFRLRQETVRTAQENGHSLATLVSAGFTTALEVPQQWLRFYELREVAPQDVSDASRHIAVGIDESSFTLAAIEDLLDHSKRSRTTLHEYQQTIDDQASRIERLERELAAKEEKCKLMETEKTALQQEVEVLRESCSRSPTPSALLCSNYSSHFLVDRGMMDKMRAPASMERLRNTLELQSQLVSGIERNASQRAGEIWAGRPRDVIDKKHDIRSGD